MVSGNLIELGDLRTGTLYEGDLESANTQVVLQRLDGVLQVTVSWSSQESPFSRWFLASDHSDRVGPPSTMWFEDFRGLLQLVGCWPSTFWADIKGPGSGIIRCRYVVMDPEHAVDYREANGVESQISGLAAWLDASSWERNEDVLDSRKVSYSRVPFPSLEVGSWQGFQVSINPSSGWAHQEGFIRLGDDVLCKTTSPTPRPWQQHTDLHEAIRELLVISRWWNESCVPLKANHQGDPMLTYGGSEIGPAWRTVAVPDEKRREPPTHHRPHLIPFADLGVRGLQDWLELRDRYRRAIGPVISSFDLHQVDYSTALAHIGPGIEALAFYLLDEDGLSREKLNRVPLRCRAARILQDVEDVLPFDGSRWAHLFVKSYNGVKHVNRDWPSDADMANSIRGCVLATRAWVACRLGIPREHVQKVLKSDHYAATVVPRNL